jgi:hypothetical protein
MGPRGLLWGEFDLYLVFNYIFCKSKRVPFYCIQLSETKHFHFPMPTHPPYCFLHLVSPLALRLTYKSVFFPPDCYTETTVNFFYVILRLSLTNYCSQISPHTPVSLYIQYYTYSVSL